MLECVGIETDRDTGKVETKLQFGRRREMPHHFVGNSTIFPTFEPFWRAVVPLATGEMCKSTHPFSGHYQRVRCS